MRARIARIRRRVASPPLASHDASRLDRSDAGSLGGRDVTESPGTCSGPKIYRLHWPRPMQLLAGSGTTGATEHD